MGTLTKGDFNYPIETFDLKTTNDYLEGVKERSDGAERNHKSVIRNCLDCIKKPIEEITMIDIRDYLKDVINIKKNRDGVDLKLDSKETYRSYLKSFFYYVQLILLDQNIDYKNPVPIKKVYQFSKQETSYKKVAQTNGERFTIEELNEILEKAHIVDRNEGRDFVLFGILITTGMRISEALTIKNENIHPKERYIETGIVKNARKSTREEALLFFFPEKFRPFLEKYLLILKNSKSEWLFPGRFSHLSINSIYGYIKRNYDVKFARFHKFRKTLITNYKRNGCDLDIRETLMNHKPSSVQGESYVKESIEEKLGYYDKYYPYRYWEKAKDKKKGKWVSKLNYF